MEMAALSLTEIEEAIESVDSIELAASEDPLMRCIAASRGDYLEELVNDESELVRMCVADTGFGHDALANDESEFVRATVAEWENDKAEALSGNRPEEIRQAAWSAAQGVSKQPDKQEPSRIARR